MTNKPTPASQPTGHSGKIEEIRSLLSEAYQFKSTSRAAQENINAALDLLDEIAQPRKLAASTPQASDAQEGSTGIPKRAWSKEADMMGSWVEAERAPSGDTVKIMRDLLYWAENTICPHEETHRGGAIWEICDACGAKWADDEGGRPPSTTPTPLQAAHDWLDGQRAGNAAPTELQERQAELLRADLKVLQAVVDNVAVDESDKSAFYNVRAALISHLHTSAAAPGDLPPLMRYEVVSLRDGMCEVSAPNTGTYYRVADVWPVLSTKGASLPWADNLSNLLREYANNNGYSHNDYADIMRQAADALDFLASNAGAAPGWKLVPINPTPAMMDAAEACSNDWPRTTWNAAWAAMLSAAPSDTSPVGATQEKE